MAGTSLAGNSLRNQLKGLLNEVLPHLSEDGVENLMGLLLEEGVKKVADMRHMTIVILKRQLDTVDATDLYIHCQNNYGSNSNIPSRSHAGTSSNLPSTQPLAENLHRLARNVLHKMPTYDSESSVMPKEVQEAMVKKTRPRWSARNMMVANIVDDCSKTVPNLERSMFNSVANALVADYPDTFKDTIPTCATGSKTLANQLKNHFDNEKRPDRNKKNKSKATEPAAYGCIAWNPPMPDEESLETLEKKREELVTMYARARRDWIWREIKKKLEETYFLQRKHLNAITASQAPQRPPPKKRQKRQVEAEVDNPDDPLARPTENLDTVAEKWPFLMTLKGMNIHFKILTGVDFKEELEKYLRENATNLVEYLASKSDQQAALRRQMTRAERAGRGGATSVAFIMMLSEIFKEDVNHLVLLAEQTLTFSDVDDAVTFPSDFPVIVATGPSFHHTDKFFVCVNKKAIAKVKLMTEAIIMLFEAYFVLPIPHYAQTNICLLYFLQRVVADISPLTGRKASTAEGHKRAQDKVSKFCNRFAEYDQMILQRRRRIKFEYFSLHFF